MGERGWGPKNLLTTDRYRVEECIPGKALTFLEFRNAKMRLDLGKLLSEVNYEPELSMISKKIKGESHNFYDDFLAEKGWYQEYQGFRDSEGWQYSGDADQDAIVKEFDDMAKDGGFVDELTAATISSRGITDAISKGLNIFSDKYPGRCR